MEREKGSATLGGFKGRKEKRTTKTRAPHVSPALKGGGSPRPTGKKGLSGQKEVLGSTWPKTPPGEGKEKGGHECLKGR